MENKNVDKYDATAAMDRYIQGILEICKNDGKFLKCNEKGQLEMILEEEHKEIMATAGKTWCLNCGKEEYLIDIKDLNIVQCKGCGKVEIEEVKTALLTHCKNCYDKRKECREEEEKNVERKEKKSTQTSLTTTKSAQTEE